MQPLASFVVSLDTELAWGNVDRPRPDSREPQYKQTREVITRILEMFERFEISGTWAFVGHLMLNECAEEYGTLHPSVIRPDFPWVKGDWFQHDPGSNCSEAPFWYAPDVVRQVMDCRVTQEIGAHGFSHMIIGAPGCTREAFASELDAFDAAAALHGFRARSFVYPRNSIGHIEELEHHGYAAYRGLSPAWFTRFPGKAQRIARFIDAFLPFGGSTSLPSRQGSIWDIPASYLYLHRNGWARWVPISFRVSKAIRAMRKAAREGSMFHLWFHPFNLASDPENLLAGLEAILEEFRSLRESGLMVSRTMADVAELMDENEAPGRLEPAHSAN